MSKMIIVEVAFATPGLQKILSVTVPEGSSIETAIFCSTILQLFPEIDLAKQKVGIFGKLRELSDTVNAGDRIEIYRPLTIDPKEARRAKAKRAQKK